MKKTICVAHDPGGFEVVYPVYRQFLQNGLEAELHCYGQAAVLNPEYTSEEATLWTVIGQSPANIHMLITGTSYNNRIELRAIQCAKSAGIPTVTIMDYWGNYAERFRDPEGVLHYPDYYIVMDQMAGNEALAKGVPPETLQVLGHPGLDHLVTGHSLRAAPTEQGSRILFISQPIEIQYGRQFGYTEQDVLRDCIEAMGSKPDSRLSVKFHPREDKSLTDNHQQFAVEGALSTLIPQYDLIIGMFSTGLLHAVLAGVPALSYQPGLIVEDHCIASRLGIIPLVHNPQQLKETIDQLLLPDLAVNDQDRLVTLQEFIWMDGKSAERIFKFLHETFHLEAFARSQL